jgi:hypothetical protein
MNNILHWLCSKAWFLDFIEYIIELEWNGRWTDYDYDCNYGASEIRGVTLPWLVINRTDYIDENMVVFPYITFEIFWWREWAVYTIDL